MAARSSACADLAQPEIGLRDFLARDVGLAALQHDAAFQHAEHAVGDVHGARQILLDQDDRRAESISACSEA